MQFTEYELTAAVTGATKSVMAGKKLRKRGVYVDAGWDAMDRYHRFRLLDAVGSQVLPVWWPCLSQGRARHPAVVLEPAARRSSEGWSVTTSACCSAS
jgi:hypothetical protein